MKFEDVKTGESFTTWDGEFVKVERTKQVNARRVGSNKGVWFGRAEEVEVKS